MFRSSFSTMDPDVEFFGVEIPPNKSISVEEHLESDETSYSSIHATQVTPPVATGIGQQQLPLSHCIITLYQLVKQT